MPREKRTTGMEAISSRASAYRVDVDLIKIQEGFNQRDIDWDQVNILVRQILEVGRVIVPITGFYMDMHFMLNHGHHRYYAVRKIVDEKLAEGEKLEEIRNIVCMREAPPIGKNEHETKMAEARLLARQIVDNSGKPFLPIECARVCNKLETVYGLSQQEISQLVGYSVSQVSNWLKLMTLPENIQEDISEGTIASTLVNDLIREHGSEKALNLINKVVAKAKSNGNKKVTKKDVEEDLNITKLTKRQIREIIEKLDYRALENGRVTVDADQFKAILGFFE